MEQRLARKLSKMLKASALGLIYLSGACGDNKKSHDNGQGGCMNCGGSQTHIAATADLSNAFGLLVIDKSSTSSLRLMEKHNKRVLDLGLKAPLFKAEDGPAAQLLSEDKETYLYNGKHFKFPRPGLNLYDNGEGAPMQKIDKSSGEIKDALTQDEGNNNGFGPQQTLPKLATIAVSPKKDVYLHFENSYVYKDAPSDSNPWDQSSGYQCQFFKVTGGTLDQLLTEAPSNDNLSCIDNAHFIWSGNQFANGIFQFDSSGSIYYPGAIPNTQNTLVFRQAREGTVPPEEIINANIRVQGFLATSIGGLFYTGQTCQTQDCGGGGGGFFRYVAPGDDGQIIEIARDWYQFIYDTNHNKSKNAGDQAVFFGPNPLSASTASWQSACLFNFDPSKTDPTNRISPLITCGDNIWDWMSLQRSVDVTTYGEGYNNYTGSDRANFSPTSAWKKEYRRRCETKDEVFAGGGSQISSIKQDSAGGVYVIGNVGKKAEGKITCSLDFRGPHCTIDGFPVLKDDNDAAYTSTSCAADAGTWVDNGTCSSGAATSEACIVEGRTWDAGYCSNSDYTTKAACEAATGCSNRWYTDSTACTNAGFTWHAGSGDGLVWRTGRCNNFEDKYETEAACTGAGKTWTADNWSGSCTNPTDTDDNAALYNNNMYACLPTWSTSTVHYDNVAGEICSSDDTGSRSTFWDWNNKANNFNEDGDSTHSAIADLSGKYITGNMNCSQVTTGSGSGGNSWTTEYTAFAKVDTARKTLLLRSLPSEKAIDLWLVDDVPYYSSFDTNLGQYLLNTMETGTICVDTSITSSSACTNTGLQASWKERQCVLGSITTEAACTTAGYTWETAYPKTIISNFEAYNVADGGTTGKLYADGLNFSNNEYQFGTVDVKNKKISLKQGLTGTLKTIVILPKD